MVTNKDRVQHAYLCSAAGRPVEVTLGPTEVCPECGRGTQPARLGYLWRTNENEMLQCPRCDYSRMQKRTRP